VYVTLFTVATDVEAGFELTVSYGNRSHHRDYPLGASPDPDGELNEDDLLSSLLQVNAFRMQCSSTASFVRNSRGVPRRCVLASA